MVNYDKPQTLHNRSQVREARAEGKLAYLRNKGRDTNPYPAASLLAFAWDAGYQQHVASEDQLHASWLKQRENPDG